MMNLKVLRSILYLIHATVFQFVLNTDTTYHCYSYTGQNGSMLPDDVQLALGFSLVYNED